METKSHLFEYDSVLTWNRHLEEEIKKNNQLDEE